MLVRLTSSTTAMVESNLLTSKQYA